MLIIEKKRLLLREFTREDVKALAHILSDPETMRFYPSPLDQCGVVEWIDRNMLRYQKNGHGLWAMVLKLTDEVVGDCGLTEQVIDGKREIQIGITCAAICGDKAWLPRPHLPAGTTDSGSSVLTGSSR